MSDRSLLLDLPYILPSQAQKHVTHNEALRGLDALVQLSVGTRSLSAPPATPVPAARYIVAAPAEGEWLGQEDTIACYEESGGWSFYTPQAGWQAYVLDEDIQTVWDGTQWRFPGQADVDDLNAQTLGLNTGADAVNRLSVSADATLLTHSGGDHRLKVNKAADTDTASLLFQSGFTGHAEMGLTGGTDFALRVSPDGSSFNDALSVDAATGTLSAPAGIGFGSTSLSHYEEGTWTPRLTFGDDDTGVTYDQQLGLYTRIGNLVMLQCAIDLSDQGAATGIAEIQDLPFEANPLYFPGEVFFVGGVSGMTIPKCRTRPGQKIQLFNGGPNGISSLTDGNFSNASILRVTLSHTI
ncbi:MAG: DUF2793 domain-containing protein [Sulfitobacter sp.]